MQDHAIRVLNIAERDIQRQNVADLVRLFGKISQAPEDSKKLRSQVVLGFPSYDDDPRPNWAIPEIRAFVQAVDKALPYFPYFLVGDPTLGYVLFYLVCLVPFKDLKAHAYAPVDLITVALRKTSDVAEFCERIGDDADRATEPILLNLPAEIAQSNPALVEKILDAMRPTLLVLERDLAKGARTPEAKAYASQVLSHAATLCGLERSHHESDVAVLRKILVRTAHEVSNDELDRFKKSFDASTERLGGGKLGISSTKIREVVRQQKHAAYRFVELHLVLAAAQPGYLQPAAMIAAAIEIEFGDGGPMGRIQERAAELGVGPEAWMPGLFPDRDAARAKAGPRRPSGGS